MQRIGFGTDRHRLSFGKPLVLGGITVPSPKGAVGHSDADVLTHAVIDAVLGGAGLGDIGHHFPDNDPQYKGAYSIDLLHKAMMIVSNAGYRIVNVDCTVHLETPKLGRYKQEISTKLAESMGIPSHMVNVKAKTGEGIGVVGLGEAIEAHAVALVENTSLT